MKFKRGIFFVNFFLLFIMQISASVYPEKLSNEALISIVNVDYKKEKAVFSKSVLRFYDKSAGFDEAVDFSYFPNFEDPLFFLKFYFSTTKAKIIFVSFLEFAEKETIANKAQLSEIILDLTYPEISYIFNFIKTMRENLPDYSYDFDLEKNNSFTHISAILNDASDYFPQTTSKRSFFTYSRHLSLKFARQEKMLPIQVFSSQENFYDSNLKDSVLKLPSVSFSDLFPFIIFSSIVFLYTTYQSLVLYTSRFYFFSIFKILQIFDFLFFFFSGINGTIIILQNFISNQSIFHNNLKFLYLFPLNIAMAFNIYFSFIKSKFLKIYWILISSLTALYILFDWIFSREFPVLDLFIALPVFIRSIYFEMKIFHKSSVLQEL